MSAAAPHNPPTFDEREPELYKKFLRARKVDRLPQFFKRLSTPELKAFAEAWYELAEKKRQDDGSYEYTLSATILPEVFRRLK